MNCVSCGQPGCARAKALQQRLDEQLRENDRLCAVVADLIRERTQAEEERDRATTVLLASPDERSRVALKVLADLLAERRGSDVTEDDDVDTALERMARELVG